MATASFFFYLGTAREIDAPGGRNTSENHTALDGATFGDTTSPISANVRTMSDSPLGNHPDGSTTACAPNNTHFKKTFSLNGDPPQTHDSTKIYKNTTITYTDGTTATVNAIVTRDTAGNLYLMPPPTGPDAYSDALELKPIQSVTLGAVAPLDGTGIYGPSAGRSASDLPPGRYGGSIPDGTKAVPLIRDFDHRDNVICFTAGTAIQTPLSERRIETLKAGNMVVTLDNGPRPIRWIGQRTVRATGRLAPIRFAKGAIGNHRDLLVSPQHRILCGGYMTKLHFGEPEVLAPAKSLVDEFGVTVAYGGMVTYVHMLFDAHEIVIANGAPSESFFPGHNALGTLSESSRDEIFRLFPHLRSTAGSYGPASRVCVRSQEARALVGA